MLRIPTIILALVVLAAFGCGKSNLSDYSLGAETYPGNPNCKQAYFKGKPIFGVFLLKLIKADGERLEGIACHNKNIVIDVKTSLWKEGNL